MFVSEKYLKHHIYCDQQTMKNTFINGVHWIFPISTADLFRISIASIAAVLFIRQPILSRGVTTETFPMVLQTKLCKACSKIVLPFFIITHFSQILKSVTTEIGCFHFRHLWRLRFSLKDMLISQHQPNG